MAGKPFSPELYSDDDNAKDLLISFLSAQGWEAWVNPDQYGIDVLSVDPYGDNVQFEVEVKHNWRGRRFQYDGVHFSARKKKFATPDYSTIFFMFNHERTHALIVYGKDWLDSPVIVKDTIYTRQEPFVEVPVSKCKFIDLGEHLDKQW